jgi:hypothetical protein
VAKVPNREFGEQMNKNCPITNEPCFLAEYNGVRCAQETEHENAITCIKNLRELNLELMKEIKVLDEWVNDLRNKIATINKIIA